MTDISQVGKVASAIARWWVQESRAVLPARLRSFLDADTRPRLVLRMNEEGPAATLLDRFGKTVFSDVSEWRIYSRLTLDSWKKAATAHHSAFELVLSLPDTAVIGAHLPIPAQAAPHIQEILRDHIRRKVPLPLDRILFGYTTASLDHDRLLVRYAILSKDRLHQALSRLELRADEIAAVTVPGDERQAPVEIRTAAMPERVRPRTKRLAAVMAATCLGLVVAGSATTAWRQDALLQEFEKRADAIAVPAKKIAQQLKQLEDDHRRIGELLADRKAPGAVMVWEELARLLPDTTYLTEVNIRGHELQITGLSAAATDITPLLDKSPLLRDVGLSGPVLTDRATGKQQFSLRAKLRSARLSLEQGE